jgi:hypothetical protein
LGDVQPKLAYSRQFWHLFAGSFDYTVHSSFDIGTVTTDRTLQEAAHFGANQVAMQEEGETAPYVSFILCIGRKGNYMSITRREPLKSYADNCIRFIPVEEGLASFTPVSPPHSGEQVIAVATMTAPSLWIPLDEAVYDWTTFVTLSLHTAALVASGTALLALSWEQSALRHYTKAQQALPGAKTLADRQHVVVLLQQALGSLKEATDRWRRVIVWLDRYAQSYDNPPDTEMLETIRERYQQVTIFQHRLWMLSGFIRQEQQRYEHPLMEASDAIEGGTD